MGKMPDGSPFMRLLLPGLTECLNQKPDVRALDSHDTSKVIGRTRANTLLLMPSDAGLNVRITLPKTQIAEDLAEKHSRRPTSTA
jgi:phage head maturation protease